MCQYKYQMVEKKPKKQLQPRKIGSQESMEIERKKKNTFTLPLNKKICESGTTNS